MRKSELHYDYPDHLIATEPKSPPRVMLSLAGAAEPLEQSFTQALTLLNKDDILVINRTQAVKRRLFTEPEQREILFLQSFTGGVEWSVLMPSRDLKLGDRLTLPEGLVVEVIAKGRPQRVKVCGDQPLTESYFQKHAEVPLPPYIQKSRGERHTRPQDESWYRTLWGTEFKSFAAPTASLHFREENMQQLREQGVQIETVTLHVGLGTFLPVVSEDLREHLMHKEEAEVSVALIEKLTQARKMQHKTWSLGTTVTRALESVGCGRLPLNSSEQTFRGETDLMILPGHEWCFVDGLATNFHQPESTLLALVCAFAGTERTMAAYRWAVAREFRLFSYGDFSLWTR